MGKENNLWLSSRPVLKKAGFFTQRIETSTGDGVPDVWVGWEDGYAWIENKSVLCFPKREATRVFGAEGLRVEQVNWHIEATRLRVRAFVFGSVGTGAKRVSYLVPCQYAQQFNGFTKRELEPFLCPVQKLPEALKKAGVG